MKRVEGNMLILGEDSKLTPWQRFAEESPALTRPPDEDDLVDLERELNRLGARYVVIGGLAINRLGSIRATEDPISSSPATWQTSEW